MGPGREPPAPHGAAAAPRAGAGLGQGSPLGCWALAVSRPASAAAVGAAACELPGGGHAQSPPQELPVPGEPRPGQAGFGRRQLPHQLLPHTHTKAGGSWGGWQPERLFSYFYPPPNSQGGLFRRSRLSPAPCPPPPARLGCATGPRCQICEVVLEKGRCEDKREANREAKHHCSKCCGERGTGASPACRWIPPAQLQGLLLPQPTPSPTGSGGLLMLWTPAGFIPLLS